MSVRPDSPVTSISIPISISLSSLLLLTTKILAISIFPISSLPLFGSQSLLYCKNILTIIIIITMIILLPFPSLPKNTHSFFVFNIFHYFLRCTLSAFILVYFGSSLSPLRLQSLEVPSLGLALKYSPSRAAFLPSLGCALSHVCVGLSRLFCLPVPTSVCTGDTAKIITTVNI